MIKKLGSRRVWPVCRGCLLLAPPRRSVFAHLFLWLVIPTCVLRLISVWYQLFYHQSGVDAISVKMFHFYDAFKTNVKGLRGQVVKTSVSYHETSHLQPASVWILLGPMWLCEKVCQFTCGRSVVSSQIRYIVSGFSLTPIKTDRHHITEILLSMAKNDKQTNKQTNNNKNKTKQTNKN
jgi:hypothetical protein